MVYFFGCNSLISLPNLSNWNISNAINLSSLFYGCESLKYLFDKSKWNISKMENIPCLFADISK